MVVFVVGFMLIEFGSDIGGLICNLLYCCGMMGYKLLYGIVFVFG